MKFNQQLFLEYKNLMKTTSIQAAYQQVLAILKYIYITLQKEMKDYNFHPRIVENKMDFSYFQITNQKLKDKGLKIQIVFIHSTCHFEIWMSGYNRKIQSKYNNLISLNQCPFITCENPYRNDFIAKIVFDETEDPTSSKVITQMEYYIKLLEEYFLSLEKNKDNIKEKENGL